VFYPRTNLDHHPAGLVAQDKRRLYEEFADPSMLKIMEIRAANPYIFQFYQDFISFGLGNIPLNKTQFHNVRHHGGFHLSPHKNLPGFNIPGSSFGYYLANDQPDSLLYKRVCENVKEDLNMIICCGEALIDMIRAGFPGQGNGFLPFPGGSPYNTAIAIGRLGVPVKFLGRFSTDFFGEILIKRFKDNHVGDDLVIRAEQNSTLAFVKLEKGKEPQYVFYTEGTADRSLSVGDLPKNLPSDTRCILFGSIAMTMEPIATAIETLILHENARSSGGNAAPVISFDPNIRPFMIKDKKAYVERFEKWIAASTIAKISAADFEFIYPDLELEKSLQKILSMGPRLVITTLGAKGAMAMLRRNDGSVTQASAPVVDLPVADTIGAGDTFHGAFLSWLEIKGKMSRSGLANLSEADLCDALFFANKAASIVCSRQGADPPTLKEVERLKPPSPKAAAKAPKNPGVKKTVPKEGAKAAGAGTKPQKAEASKAKGTAKTAKKK
jgi:fructokinase